MAKKQLWAIIGIAFAAAIISSVITASIIGNAAAAQANIYTKSGIDAITKGCCNNSTSYRDILNNLSQCTVVVVGFPPKQG